jgi:alkylation response protein AidB-like acyl-CoA dehydrogenase
MEFGLSDDQRMFQASVEGYLQSAVPLETVRKIADGDGALQTGVEDGLQELGVNLVLAAEVHEGLGLGLLDAALVQEALGAGVTPSGHLATAMAITGIKHGASEAQQAEWLPKIASGTVRMAVAVTEHTGTREGAGVVAAHGKLNGKALFAMETTNATHVVVVDKTGGLHIAAMDSVQQRALATIDRTRDFAELVFEDVAAVKLEGHSGAVDKMVEAGRLLLAADTLGAAQAMLDQAVEYAKERKQFNRAIGSFQSVKHLCAEMAAHLEPARALVWHAAHAVDENMDEASVMVCLAKSHLSEIGTFIARTSTEVHGGMGFTDLVGLHYWFKRIGANRQLLGSPEKVREDAARLQGWA